MTRFSLSVLRCEPCSFKSQFVVYLWVFWVLVAPLKPAGKSSLFLWGWCKYFFLGWDYISLRLVQIFLPGVRLYCCEAGANISSWGEIIFLWGWCKYISLGWDSISVRLVQIFLPGVRLYFCEAGANISSWGEIIFFWGLCKYFSLGWDSISVRLVQIFLPGVRLYFRDPCANISSWGEILFGICGVTLAPQHSDERIL